MDSIINSHADNVASRAHLLATLADDSDKEVQERLLSYLQTSLAVSAALTAREAGYPVSLATYADHVMVRVTLPGGHVVGLDPMAQCSWLALGEIASPDPDDDPADPELWEVLAIGSNGRPLESADEWGPQPEPVREVCL